MKPAPSARIARMHSAGISMPATAAPCPFGPLMHRRSIDWALRVVQRRGCVRPTSRIHLTFSAHTPPLMCTGMRDLIHLRKFQNRPQLTGLLADLLLSRLPTAPTESLTTPRAAAHTILVPIPTQWRWEARRGFDHTWLLANAIRSQCLQPAAVRPWLLSRHYRAARHRLNKKSRLADTRDRFVARPSIAGHKVVLIDDVMTTGATARAVAHACAEAGARSVVVWCLARTPAPFAVE